ncbi:hypothetical protein TEQG_04834 [Trichophyton equinum CBS 127.97]|uniref:Uncharacterized protein n=1 Tax=Trichophyton equinum (strain ATCC MYA-4606 / CBS 127.97) TaxID=559882 RepID=F2PVA6_TRIEC|nr:hypothetical protein TEQG_04834 [Trichophyton equinum CBS 127.97]
MTDKYRVFVATYFRQGITSDKRNRTILKYATYHWAIWIEGKKSTGPGHCFDVKEHPPFSNFPNSGGWKYECRHENLAESHGMLGRMMIGKLPKGVTVQDVDGLLQGILYQNQTRRLSRTVSAGSRLQSEYSRRKAGQTTLILTNS